MAQALASGTAADKTPSELLSMLDSLCFYRIEEWWTYELCYKKHVRQFHKDHDKVCVCAYPQMSCCCYRSNSHLLPVSSHNFHRVSSGFWASHSQMVPFHHDADFCGSTMADRVGWA